MKKFLIFFVLFSIKVSLSAQSIIVVKKQTSGPVRVNSYLIYDPVLKEAAIIDVGSKIDSLIDIVELEKLNLKYILLTHAHQDHIVGLKILKNKYPLALVGFTENEYKDIPHYSRWRDIFDQKSVETWRKDAAMESLMDFDYSVGEPEIFLEENQTLKLGSSSILVLSTPGHSRGGLTFSIAKCLFPGDLILYHSTGYLNYFLCSKDAIEKSILNLYKIFPDETIIYPGHGKSSTVGYEKINNKIVLVDK